MIGRMKASRTAGEAERRAAAAAMRNLDLREYIGVLISSGIFVRKAGRESLARFVLRRGLA